MTKSTLNPEIARLEALIKTGLTKHQALARLKGGDPVEKPKKDTKKGKK